MTLQLDGRDYIVYHRLKRPFPRKILMREIGIDRFIFGEDGSIKPIVPTDEGVTLP